MRFRTTPGLAIASLAFLLSTSASAAFHEIAVKEVFAGSPAHPNAQYVLLQAYSLGQSAVTGHSVLTFDAAGNPSGTFEFTGPVGTGANQMTIFVATPEAATIFNITADLTMTAVLSPAGGKVCWDGSTPDDCFAWGNYTGSATGVGTPYNATGGLIPGYAARRRLDICLSNVALNSCDDTNVSSADFVTAVPHPIKNGGAEGQTPPATCGNGAIEGLESCDDNDTEGGDGCSAVCQTEALPPWPLDLGVDPTDTAASDGNGVFEPGEAVRIRPTWMNGGSGDLTMTGQLTNFRGPAPAPTPTPNYIVSDGAAEYPTISPFDAGSCDPGSDCYLVFADAPSGRPVQHWDTEVDEILDSDMVLTWPLHLGDSFPDVPRDHPFYAFVENLFHNGVTGGCAGGGYCPGNPVTRGQMAVFLLKALNGDEYVPAACTGVFPDVPCPSLFADWVEQLASDGVTAGCGGGLYCPDTAVTREQMAVFLLKTLEGSAYMPPPAAGVFDDVPDTDPFAPWIEELFSRQITGGCSAAPPLYCPDSPNNRGQMAVFLVKTFGLRLYGFPPVIL